MRCAPGLGITLGLVASLGAGCAARRPVGVAAVGSASAAADAREALRARADREVLLDGELRLRGSYRGERFRARAIVRGQRGGRLYLETVGEPAFVLASDGVEIRLILPSAREWLRAPADARTVAALVGLDLTPEELVAVLAGTGAPAAAIAGGEARGARLVLANGTLTIDAETHEVRAGEVGGVRLTYPTTRSGRRVDLEVAGERLRLTVETASAPASDGALAAGPPEGLFRPPPPAGFREIEIADLAQPVLLRWSAER